MHSSSSMPCARAPGAIPEWWSWLLMINPERTRLRSGRITLFQRRIRIGVPLILRGREDLGLVYRDSYETG